MAMSKDSLKKRYQSTADTYKKKGDREWAKAKNDEGGYHYEKARDAYDRAKRNQEKADKM